MTVTPGRGRNRESLGAGPSWPWGSGSRPMCDSHHLLVTEQVTGGAAVHTLTPPAHPSPRLRTFQPFPASQIPAGARPVQHLPQTGGSERTPQSGPPTGSSPQGAPSGERAASQRSLSVLLGPPGQRMLLPPAGRSGPRARVTDGATPCNVVTSPGLSSMEPSRIPARAVGRST